MPIGSFSFIRFWKVSRSIIRATVMRPASLRKSWNPKRSNHSEFRRISALDTSTTFGHLLDVRREVPLDLLARELRPQLVPPAGVPHHRRRVADDEDDRVAELLDRAELHQRDRVADVEVRRARIHAELHAQGLLRLQRALDALGELALLDQVDDAALEDGELAVDFGAHGIRRAGAYC
jgi:hypothetical protein